MDCPELIILDVGHGNCTLLRDTNGVILIDCPPGAVLLETLNQLDITEIEHVLISHADQDHIAGIPQLLLNEDIKIKSVHLNSDWVKDTAIWADVRSALGDARKRSQLVIEAQLTTSTTCRLNVGEINVEVLAPSPEIVLGGIGSRDSSGRKLKTNSMSAVISLACCGRRVAIVAGDLDQIGLNNFDEELSLNAEVLVFPHHGGKPGSRTDSKHFASAVCQKIQPKLVIFSIDRKLHGNPKQKVMEGVLSAVPDAHILCTQLSEHCSTTLPQEMPIHTNDLPAKGQASGKCCAGTIVIKLKKEGTLFSPSFESHQEFVAKFPNSLCQRNMS